MDRREELLKKWVGSHVFDELIDQNSGILSAMDEYFKERALGLLEYMAKKRIICNVTDGQCNFLTRGETLTKEQVFENFL
jgi:hypothetical protein